jgi:hypothetical protein
VIFKSEKDFIRRANERSDPDGRAAAVVLSNGYTFGDLDWPMQTENPQKFYRAWRIFEDARGGQARYNSAQFVARSGADFAVLQRISHNDLKATRYGANGNDERNRIIAALEGLAPPLADFFKQYTFEIHEAQPIEDWEWHSWMGIPNFYAVWTTIGEPQPSIVVDRFDDGTINIIHVYVPRHWTTLDIARYLILEAVNSVGKGDNTFAPEFYDFMLDNLEKADPLGFAVAGYRDKVTAALQAAAEDAKLYIEFAAGFNGGASIAMSFHKFGKGEGLEGVTYLVGVLPLGAAANATGVSAAARTGAGKVVMGVSWAAKGGKAVFKQFTKLTADQATRITRLIAKLSQKDVDRLIAQLDNLERSAKAPWKSYEDLIDVYIKKLPTEIHHLASNKGTWAKKFQKLFDRAGIDLDDAVNRIDLPGHIGRHTEKYHQWVYDQLEAAVGTRTGQAAKDALTKALDKIRKALETNPRLPYFDGGL